MLNSKCAVDCTYCYADLKTYKAQVFPLDRFKELVKEAKELKMENIDIIGGDVFMLENWFLYYKILVDNGFKPYATTKVPLTESPLTESNLNKFKELNLSLQFSLDTVDKVQIGKMLNTTDSYLSKIINSIKYADKIGIPLIIHAIITKHNSSENSIKDLLSFIGTLTNIEKVTFSPVGFSLYKQNFKQIKLTTTEWSSIGDFLYRIKENYLSKKTTLQIDDNLKDTDLKNKNVFDNRTVCSGIISEFFVLPSGQVTICEQLYGHDRFIIGDVSNRTILNMWQNSKLHFLNKSSFKEDSACLNCSDFDDCFSGSKGICWLLSADAYGTEKTHFPDPRCPKAPDATYTDFVAETACNTCNV